MTHPLAVDLARANLPDFVPEALVRELADHIQNSIECWLQSTGDLSGCPRSVATERRFAVEDS